MSNETVYSDIAASVWKIETNVGEQVSEEDTLMILESMKMEIPVESPVSGTILEICVSENEVVQEGQPLAIVKLAG